MSKTLAEKLKALDKFSDGFNKAKGKVLAGRLSRHEELVDRITVKFLPTPSLNVNAAMGGGFPMGRTTIVTGLADSGKTFILLESIAMHMKEDPNYVAGWLESEESITIDTLEMFGIDPERFFYLVPSQEGAEETLNAVLSTIASGGITFFVVNSLKCLVPSEELQKGVEKLQVGLAARMNAKMMRKITPVIAETKTALVLVQHLSTEIGSMSRDPLTLSGGLAIRYGACTIVDLRKRSIADSDPISREDGIKIGVTITKNHAKTDVYPYVKTLYYGIFGQGTERYLEALDLAKDAGILLASGSFIKVPDEEGNAMILEDGTKLQWQGAAKFRQYCIENPDFFNELVSQLDGKTETLSEEEVNEIKSIEEQEAKMAEALGDDPISKASKKAKK